MDFFVNGQRVSWPSMVTRDGKPVQEQVNHLDLGSAWSWNYNESFEVRIETYVRFGEINTFTFRTRDKWNWGGIFKRAQLITPLTDPPLPTHRATVCDCSR